MPTADRETGEQPDDLERMIDAEEMRNPGARQRIDEMANSAEMAMRLRELREALGVSVSEMARRSSLRPSDLRRIEAGRATAGELPTYLGAVTATVQELSLGVTPARGLGL